METDKIEQSLKKISANINAREGWKTKEKNDFLRMADYYMSAEHQKHGILQKISDFFGHSRARVALLSVSMIVVGTLALVNIYKPRTSQLTTFTPSASVTPAEAKIDRDDAFRALSNSKEYISVAGQNAVNTGNSSHLLKDAELAFAHEDFTGVVDLCDQINTFLDQFVIADKPTYLEKGNRNKAATNGVSANEDPEPTPNTPADPGIAGVEP